MNLAQKMQQIYKEDKEKRTQPEPPQPEIDTITAAKIMGFLSEQIGITFTLRDAAKVQITDENYNSCGEYRAIFNLWIDGIIAGAQLRKNSDGEISFMYPDKPWYTWSEISDSGEGCLTFTEACLAAQREKELCQQTKRSIDKTLMEQEAEIEMILDEVRDFVAHDPRHRRLICLLMMSEL